MARPTKKPTTTTDLGRRIRVARERLGLTQTDLAKRAGVTNAAISNWELGTNRSVKQILDLARALRVSPDWLATGRGTMEPGRGQVTAEAMDIAYRYDCLTAPQRAVVQALVASFDETAQQLAQAVSAK